MKTQGTKIMVVCAMCWWGESLVVVSSARQYCNQQYAWSPDAGQH
ncbi:MAG TPA: hypothetical protein VKF36_21205 [Syntrophorhabdales bacterium]|nr:hypothetical protein [Syntrophorhabdales bacterium]